MSLESFLVIYLCCLVTMLLCRCLPLMALKGRTLPEGLVRALNLIPPAAFAATPMFFGAAPADTTADAS